MRIRRTLPPAAAPLYPRDIIAGLKGLLRGKQELRRFESELKDYFEVEHCFLVSSGKAALTLILWALKDIHPQRNEVLIPAFICYSVPSAIVRAGLTIKLCDINPDTLDFDFNQLSSQLTAHSSQQDRNHDQVSALNYKLPSYTPQPATRNPINSMNPTNSSNPTNRLLAIIPAHLFGLPADIDRVRRLVDDPDVSIIEDAAQTMGAEWRGKKLGSLGDVSFFSLGRGKALSTAEGGVILTNRKDIAEKIAQQLKGIPGYRTGSLMRLLFSAISMSFLPHPAFFWLPKSLPFLRVGDTIYDPRFNIQRMSAFQAGLAHDWQNKIKRFKEIRKNHAQYWALILEQHHINHYFSARGATQETQQTQWTQATQQTQATHLPDLLRFPVRIDNEAIRARLLNTSEQEGLGIMFTYPEPINCIQELRAHFNGQQFPMAEKAAHNLVTLPVHCYLSEKDRAQIAAILNKTLGAITFLPKDLNVTPSAF